LWSGLARLLSVVMQIWMQYRNIFIWQNWIGLAFILPLFLGYSYLQSNTMLFYWRFDAAAFYDGHQKVWLKRKPMTRTN